MRDYDKARRAGLVNKVARDVANFNFEFANSCHNPAGSPEGGQFCGGTGVGDFSDTFGGFFDPGKLADKNPAVTAAGSRALAMIDSVHGLEKGFPEAIAMVDGGDWLGPDEGSLGAYMPRELDNPEGPIERGRIVFRSTDDEGQMTMTLVHELGHHLTLGRSVQEFRDEMKKPGQLRSLMSAIDRSPTVKDLKTINKNAAKAGAPAEGVKGFTDYLLMKEELFARAYAQYIAVRTGDRKAMGALVDTLKDENDSLMQWGPEEFTPIANAMDRYLRDRGLLKE